MSILYLETSTDSAALAFREDFLLLKGGPTLSRSLASDVKKFLQGRRPTALAVGRGPGSFTGTRVGAALASGLALGWDLPLHSFCSLTAFAPLVEGPWAVLFDARTPGVYVLKNDWDAPRLLPRPEALKLLSHVPHLASPHPEKIALPLPIQAALPHPERAPLGPFQIVYLERKLPSGVQSETLLNPIGISQCPA